MPKISKSFQTSLATGYSLWIWEHTQFSLWWTHVSPPTITTMFISLYYWIRELVFHVLNHCTHWPHCMLPLDQSDSDWINHTDIQLFSYFHFFLSQSIVHIKHMCFSFKISSAPKGVFCGVGQSSSEICSLPYSLLLDYSTLRSLPYPTLLEVEKLLLVGACF